MEGPFFAAGRVAKSDCRASFFPSTDRQDGLEVVVRSSVGTLFGKAIEAAARRTAAEFGTMLGRLEVEDEGALDYVVEARVEAALRLAGFVREGPPLSGAGPVFSSAIPSASTRGPSPRQRLRRARLYLPGDQPHFAVDVGLFGADLLVFDLEDAVAKERKFESRILVRRTLEESPLLGPCEVAVRVNPLSGPWGREDLAELVRARPQAFVVPKCESAEDLRALDEELTRLELEAGLESGFVKLMPLIETAKGVLSAAQIACASSRNVGLCFGGEDFTRNIGASRRPRGTAMPRVAAAGGPAAAVALPDPTLLARQTIVLAARAAGIEPLDSVYADVEDEEGLVRSCQEGRALGFAGKGLLHPSQIASALAAFRPSAEEAAEAERIVEAFEAAAAEGKGAISVEGSMVDLPVAERARAVLAAFGQEGRP